MRTCSAHLMASTRLHPPGAPNPLTSLPPPLLLCLSFSHSPFPFLPPTSPPTAPTGTFTERRGWRRRKHGRSRSRHFHAANGRVAVARLTREHEWSRSNWHHHGSFGRRRAPLLLVAALLLFLRARLRAAEQLERAQHLWVVREHVARVQLAVVWLPSSRRRSRRLLDVFPLSRSNNRSQSTLVPRDQRGVAMACPEAARPLFALRGESSSRKRTRQVSERTATAGQSGASGRRPSVWLGM